MFHSARIYWFFILFICLFGLACSEGKGTSENGDGPDSETFSEDETDADLMEGDPDEMTLPDGDGADSDQDDTDRDAVETLDGDVDEGEMIVDGDEMEMDEAEEADIEAEIEYEADPEEAPPLIEISNVLAVENLNNSLSAIVSFNTNIETYASVLVSSAGKETWETSRTSVYSTSHEVAVVGLNANTQFMLTAKALTGENNISTADAGGFETGSLPPWIPDINLVTSIPERMWGRYTMFNISHMPSLTYGILVVDENGEVVWYHQNDTKLSEIELLKNGNIIYIYGPRAGVRIIDWLGRSVSEFSVQQLGIPAIHHEIMEMPNGNFLALRPELRTIPDERPSGNVREAEGDGDLEMAAEADLEMINVVGDAIIEITPNGVIVDSWSVWDYLDSSYWRLTGGSFWDAIFPDYAPTEDWTHGNGITYDASDDSMLVSLRNVDYILKIGRTSRQLVWRLGMNGDFELVGDDVWFGRQHAPELQPNGQILIYDNGYKFPNGGLPPARAVEYQLDFSNPENPKAILVWDYPGDEPYVAQILGDADRLPNGNTLIGDGAFRVDEPMTHSSGHVVEVSPGEDTEVVFEMFIPAEITWVDDGQGGQTPQLGRDFTFYRADRLETLAPYQVPAQ